MGAFRTTDSRLQSTLNGVVSGLSDNDPTTVATLAVVGATTIYGLSWLVILIIPMLAVVQGVATRLGATSRIGLEKMIRLRYGRLWAFVALLAVLLVNLITLGADIEAGAAAGSLLVPIDLRWFVVPLAALTAAVLIFGSYERIKSVLVYTTLVFGTYFVAAFLAHPHWADVARALVPRLEHTHAFYAGAIALLGTTLTAYAYVWQEQETVEERPSLQRLGLVQVDAVWGIVIAGLTFFFILVATGATLGVHHKNVDTATEAAQALAPVAGRWASVIFAVGLLGSALLAVPVLAATSAYVTGQMFGWNASLDYKPGQSPRFYAVLVAVLVIGSVIALLGVSPIKLLFFSGIVGGFATTVTLVLMVLLAMDRKATNARPIGPTLSVCAIAVAVIVTISAIAFVIDSLHGL